MSSTRRNNALLGFATAIVILFAWQVIVDTHLVDKRLLPSPLDVVLATIWMLRYDKLLLDISVSMGRALAGFALGSCAGIAVGVLSGRQRLIRSTLGRIIDVLRPIPAISIVPLAIIWFGLGEPSKIFIIFWGVFFPVWINTHIGISQVSIEHIWSGQSLGAGPKAILLEIILPCSATSVLAGMRTGLSVAYVCLVAAEMAGASRGLGFKITVSHLTFRIDQMISAILLLGVVGAVSDWLFMHIVHKIFPWYAQSQRQYSGD